MSCDTNQLLLLRNLSGGKANSGNNETNQDILQLITTYILKGYAIRKIEAFNDRIYLSRYRRNYWLGTKYYYMDNFNYLPTRDTCLYHMDSNERENLEYIDESPIYDIIYQCQRYAQYCCGLTCCLDKFGKDLHSSFLYREALNPWNTSPTFQSQLHFFSCLIFVVHYLYI
ncbi:unnamed protein product [Onchocerca flexuosa]|uniref:CX domain-containing protein n=1 Tax=Onchocerca flexuosa TaxID=387005 RepID=A0A183H190_9BILA|nr:unnamed protein product [Onchocerca flexuosa]